jgi:hypothetical protein
LKPLSESEEEQRIDPVMSSFFDIDEGESEEKDSVGTMLATEDITLLPMAATIPSPKVDSAAIVVTPSAIVVVEEKIGSSNPAIVEDKGKGLQGTKRLRRPLKMTRPLVKGPLIKNLVAESTGLIKELGKQWVPSN